MKTRLSVTIGSFLFTSLLLAAPNKKLVLTDINLLEQAKIKPLLVDEATGIATAEVSGLQESMLIRKSHENGRCAGFELLDNNFSKVDFKKVISQINARKQMDEKELKSFRRLRSRSAVSEAISNVSPANIKGWVDWLSAFGTRYHKGPKPNDHVVALQARLDEELKKYPSLKASTSLLSHTSTGQKSLRLTIPGKTRPEEIVAMGAHLDSINMGFLGPTNGKAPGSDDDASGSASILEALGHILQMAPYDRTIEMFWYAGEEAGLLGSKEIAASYKSESKKVVGVLQLDMTLYPGSGGNNIASMTDYTSPEMRNLLTEFNRLYLNVNIIDDKCGYGCSDHASWYKNGYPTLMPTEATFNQMNKQIHGVNDTVNSGSSFEHAAIFSKIAIAFASHLANP